MEEIVIFIFRRDLRIFDNTSLNTLQKNYPKLNIIPIFIFNKNQIDKNLNKYYSANSVQFLFESLNDLSFLNFYYSNNDISILNDIKKRFIIKAIAFNKDYTPFAINRDNEIKNWCNSNNIILISEEDYTLHKLNVILKDDNKPYLKYTPFYKKSLLKKPVAINNNKNKFNFKYDINNKSLKDFNFLKPFVNPNIKVNGGRKNALEILNKLKKKYFDNYYKERDYPYLDKTTKLSAFIKYGCISIREIYYILPINHAIIRELIWRDFYAYISFYFPHIYGKSFNKKYENIKWNYNEILFNKWKNGLTGFPLVDAGMRQLNISGWMHNRIRMLVASFLTKNLFIDWKKGEEYFASKLVDYDPSSNNGGWQWCASIGTDSQPYFRIFSPSAQLLKYDKECLYIKKWIPELRNIDNKIIHNWEKNNNYKEINYPIPIIDFKSTSKKFIEIFKL
jgi:deoxyribodipyrimidine photo-lyase